jgi:putative ABC transport system ATP-binding protein
MNSDSAIELRDVTKSYEGGVEALRGVSLTITSGESVAIVGPSGSGKSTLLHIMGTLDRPSSGVARIAGFDVNELDDRELAGLRARRIGFVFQQFHLLDGLSALDNVAQGMLYTRTASAERKHHAGEALERVGLGERASHRPGQLSGGERQRVAIARAIVGNPTILFADEPTGNLDTTTGEGVMKLLADLNGAGTTVIVITHNLDIALAMPRQVEIRDGVIANDASVKSPTPSTLLELSRQAGQ